MGDTSNGNDTMVQRSKMSLIIFVTAVTLLTSACLNCPIVSSTNPYAALPISTAAAPSPYTVNISGEVIGTDYYLITADFKAEIINDRTSLHLFSEPFGHGRFTIPVQIPRDADENDTFNIRVLSLDGTTVYGETNVTLNNTAPDKNYLVEILVVNPPPNYNGILIIVLLIIFALILALYIFFVRWLIGRMILNKAGEIMIERQMGKRGGGL